jgi:hypothetical protein
MPERCNSGGYDLLCMWLAKEDVGYIQNFGGENLLEDREGDGKKM